MEEIWQRIENWMKENQPDLLSELNPGAKEEQITTLEKKLKIKFPEYFRRSAMIHDGQIKHQSSLEWEILSLYRIEEEWNIWKDLLDSGEFADFKSEPEHGIKDDWWNERWIPIAADGEGNNLCLDLDPAPGGVYGQVITFWHDSGERTVEARSYRDWLGELAAKLETGKMSNPENVGGNTYRLEPEADFIASELKQKYLNEQRMFFLEEQRIRLVTRDLDGTFEKYVNYEILTPQRRSYTKQDGRILIAAISFGIFGLLGVGASLLGENSLMRWSPLWLIASLVFFGFHFYKRRNYLLVDLEDRTQMFFLKNAPSKEILEKFLEAMYAAQKRYLRTHYLQVFPESSKEDEFNKLRWLHNKGAISEAELQQMIIRLKDFFNHSKG
jgi:cell wall assembly regulator SMI1